MYLSYHYKMDGESFILPDLGPLWPIHLGMRMSKSTFLNVSPWCIVGLFFLKNDPLEYNTAWCSYVGYIQNLHSFMSSYISKR